MFATRWRWVAGVALALPRFRGGKKVPPQLLRMKAEDLVAAVFPDQIACAENLVGEREVPDHPLTNQTIADCLHEAMDIEGLERLLRAHRSGRDPGRRARPDRSLRRSRSEVLSARPYAFLDDAPLEERRTQAVMARRWRDPQSAADLGRLDPEAIARVRAEAWPDPVNADELHDALLWLGCLTEAEAAAPRRAGANGSRRWRATSASRASRRRRRRYGFRPSGWRSSARVWPDGAARAGDRAARRPDASALVERTKRWSRSCAAGSRAWGRSRRPRSPRRSGLSRTRSPPRSRRSRAKAPFCKGRFLPGVNDEQWCDRRLLARIHHYTVRRLRAEIEPVAARDFLRFLFAWQHVRRRRGWKGPTRCRVSSRARRLRGAGRGLGDRDPAGAAQGL